MLNWGFWVGAAIAYFGGSFVALIGRLAILCVPLTLVGYVILLLGEAMYGPGGETILYDHLATVVAWLIGGGLVGVIVFFAIPFGGDETLSDIIAKPSRERADKDFREFKPTISRERLDAIYRGEL